ncbi:MAG: aminotransferase class IV [Clostridium sp.]|jgi:D-alanine transaminase
MKQVGYYNGEIGALEEMKIPMLDRAVYFGDGCYDATTFANNHIFAADDHMDRFYNSCRLLEIPFSMSREELRAELQKCIDANELDHGMLYWQCSRGTAPRAHNFPPEHVKPNLMIFTVPCELIPFDQTFRLISMEDTRFLHCNIKTLNLIPSVIAYQRCIEAGCQETVFHRGERVTECAHSNVLILKDGVLCTPPRDNLILPGITLKHLLELAAANGIPTREEPFTMDELRAADEVIISSSGGLCIRADELDGQSIGGRDPKTLKILQDAYADFYARDVK